MRKVPACGTEGKTDQELNIIQTVLPAVAHGLSVPSLQISSVHMAGHVATTISRFNLYCALQRD